MGNMVVGLKSRDRSPGRASVPTLAAAVLVPAVVLALAYAPLAADSNFLVENNSAEPTGEWKLWWLLVMVCAAPLAAMAFNWRWPVATTANRAFLLAVPLIPVAVGLVLLDVRLEVHSGNLRADSGETAMAGGIGGSLAAIVGAVLMFLVAAASRWGAQRGLRRVRRLHEEA